MMNKNELFLTNDDILIEEASFWLGELLPVETQISFGLISSRG